MEKQILKHFKTIFVFLMFALLSLQSLEIQAINRFPKPEFESGHIQPPTQTPAPRFPFMEYVDVTVLILALSLTTWFVLKKRSRKGVFWMTIFSVLYFGFYREGCICSVGSIQNVSLALFQENYAIPLSAFLFFIIPLIYTLLFGRTFCAAVCPLGAIQDLVAVKPLQIKIWIEKVLGVIPFIYLALAILYSATGTDFIICRYDPFIGFYRLDASFSMFMLGAIFLIIGIFIARPYCRFLCPYGAILNLISRFSFRHMNITPSSCINCKLCENSCPYSAINVPTPLKEKEKTSLITKRYLLFSILIPIMVAVGGFLASNFYENFAMVNSKVRLENELKNNSNYGLKDKEALEITGFKSSGKSLAMLQSEVKTILHQFYVGSWIFGAFVGLVFGLTLLNLSVFKYHSDYSPDRARCHSCARCMDFCPVKLDGMNIQNESKNN